MLITFSQANLLAEQSVKMLRQTLKMPLRIQTNNIADRDIPE